MSSKTIRTTASLVALMAVCAPCRAAAALDEGVISTARALAQDGETDFKEGRFFEASDKFLKAYYAVKVPTLARSAARALVEQGRLVRASELYRQALALPANELWIGNVQQDAQNKAKEELAALMPRLARLRIQLRDATIGQVEISIDGVRVPDSLVGTNQYVDPGARHLVAKRGTEVVEVDVSLSEGEQRDTVIAFGARPQTTAQPRNPSATEATVASKPGNAKTLGWLGLGVGITGLAVGATAGVLVAIKHAELAADCPRDTCNPARVASSSTESYNALRTVSVIGFATGAVGAAVGITLLLTTPTSEKPSVSVWTGLGAAGIRGAF